MADRDSKGRFLKGCSLFGKDKPIRNGHPIGMKRQIKDALKIAEDAMPQLYLDMVRDAQDPNASIRDRQICREYLSDRIYGKPNLPITGNVKFDFSFLIGKGYERNDDRQ